MKGEEENEKKERNRKVTRMSKEGQRAGESEGMGE